MKKKKNILLALLAVFILSISGVYTFEKYQLSKSDFVIEDGVLIKYKGHEETVIIPDGVYYIKALAFDETEKNDGWIENKTLKKLIMPDSVIIVDESAFVNSYNLSEVVWSQSLDTVGQYAFNGCTSLKEVVLPLGVTYVGMRGFGGCSSLEKVVLPNTFAWSFGSTPFEDCGNIKEITCSVTEDEDGVGAILEKAKNQEQILIKGYEGTEAQKYAQENHLKFQSLGTLSDDEFVIDGEKTLIKYNGEGGDVIVPVGVEYIAAQVFANNPNIKTVTLPDSVKKMGTYEFRNSSITAVRLSEQLETISYLAFRDCQQLKELSIPKKVQFIISQSFTNCPSLERVYIPGGIRVISGRAFDETPNVTLYSNSWKIRKYAWKFKLKYKFSFGF